MSVYNYRVAGHRLVIRTADDIDLEAVVPSLVPFRYDMSECGDILFTMTIDCGSAADDTYRNIGDFDTGNGRVKVDKCDATGSYQFLIRNIREIPVALLLASADFADCRCHLLSEATASRCFAINNALMMAYAFAGAAQRTLLIHASCVKRGDTAYAFIARSGTGKSTQTGNWIACFADAELLNDDNPIVRVQEDGVYIYGSPWSGKTPCYRNIRARLGALTRIVRDQRNFVIREQPAQAFASVVATCSTMRWDSRIYTNVIDTVSAIVARVGVFSLHCLPDRESAEVCYEGIRNRE